MKIHFSLILQSFSNENESFELLLFESYDRRTGVALTSQIAYNQLFEMKNLSLKKNFNSLLFVVFFCKTVTKVCETLVYLQFI